MDNTERIKEAEQTVADFANHLVDKKIIFLEVEVKTTEAGDEIMRWMYSKEDSPMKATLLQIAWDQKLVPKEISDAVQIIRNFQ